MLARVGKRPIEAADFVMTLPSNVITCTRIEANFKKSPPKGSKTEQENNLFGLNSP
jgi:hypothetical protein